MRRALTLAIDRQTIVDTLWPGGTGRVAVSPDRAERLGASTARLGPLPYDPQEARRILAAKGWKDTNGDGVLDKGGKPFSFELLSNAGNQQRNDAAVMIQEQLKQVGVQVEPAGRGVQHPGRRQPTRATSTPWSSAITMDTSLDLDRPLPQPTRSDGRELRRLHATPRSTA